ncbi:inactive tyrosine-protein kinase 7-like isoform X2 [Macrobrachium nipponense]|uniref:inactive tyrosine-protein kinase 7-like isoform X2 n=1 Tax=Macrobrachium nipponense TaxID=159736 RepID=UPI0030C7EBE2
MYALLYCSAIVMLAKSVAVQQYEITTSEASAVSSTIASREVTDKNAWSLDSSSPGTPEPSEGLFEEGSALELNRPTRSYSVSAAMAAKGGAPGSTVSTRNAYRTAGMNPSPPPLPPPPPEAASSSSGRVYHRSSPPIRIIRRIPTTPLPQPYFDPSSPTNISAQLGMHAFLPCTIRNLNNNSISWIRSRDSHILTVDRYTFIADERFQAWHEEDTETWTLQVKYVQERDDGRYECQISTEPKMSHFVQFHVVTPLVHIPGGPDFYVKSGSTVTLKCIISGALILPEYIFWYQGTDRVLAEELTGGRQVFVERISDDTTIGTLIITTASPRDQGSYTCVPASLPTASVTLHVLNGEYPAAMHHGGAPLSRCPPSRSLLLFCLLAGLWWLSRETTLLLLPTPASASTIAYLLNLQPR